MKKTAERKSFSIQLLIFTLIYTLAVSVTLIWRNYPIHEGVAFVDRWAFYSVVTVGIALWFFVIRSIFRWQSRMKQRYHDLGEHVRELNRLNQSLTQKVSKHGGELAGTNRELREEIIRREQAEEELTNRAQQLENLNHELEDAKRAVLNILEDLEKEKKDRQLILDSSGEGLCGVDLDGKIVFVNPAALEMLGYEKEQDLIGQTWHEVIHPEGARLK